MNSILSPGQKYGPCKSCNHDRCNQSRELASSTCHLCADLIGYDRAYCFDSDLRAVHFSCLAQEIDQQNIKTGLGNSSEKRLVYNKAEAAQLLQIGESTLSEYMNRGEIAYLKLGVRVLFKPDHLTSFLDRFEVQVRPALRKVS